MTTASGIQIITENLGKRFNREWIFKNLTFTFQGGNTYAITGPNGSGKSTLLQVLWGQMPQSSGTVKYLANGQEIPVEEIFKHVSIAAPYMDVIEEFTLREQLDFHFKIKPSRNNLSVDEIMEKMNLFHARDKFISNFSSGMRQRVKLALAFFTQAHIIFLDEPGTNLDKEAFNWYLTQLKKLPTETLIFIASNNPEEYTGNPQILNITDFK